MRSIPFATVLVLAAGLASSSLAQPLAPISRTDTRAERSDPDATPRVNPVRGEFGSMRDELENFPVGVNLAAPGVLALPASTTVPDGFDWGMNNLRGQSGGEYVRVVDLSGSPVGGNATQALRILTTSAVAPGGFYAGASLRWDTRLYPTADHNARVSAEMYIGTIAQQYTFEPTSPSVGFITGRLLWGGTCVEAGPGDCTDFGLPAGPILNILALASGPSFGTQAFYPAAYCFDINGGIIPGCVPPPGASVGDQVAPPIGAWARWASETSPDARVSFYLDRFDGEGEFLIIRHAILTSSFINAVAWNSSYESQDAFMLIDNIEASGPLFVPVKPPPLDCPYRDDIEWMDPGPLAGQSPRWTVVTDAAVNVISHSPQGRVVSHVESGSGQYQRELFAELPRAAATPANDLVASIRLRTTGWAMPRFAFLGDADLAARVFINYLPRKTFDLDNAVFVQVNPAYDPIDADGKPAGATTPIIGADIVDTGYDWTTGAYRTLEVRLSANGALRVSIDGQRIYAGPGALGSSINTLALESENSVFASGANLRFDDITLTCDAPSCATDFDFDDLTSFSDLNAVLSNFGATGLTGFHPGDANADGAVNFTDLNAVLAAFGTSCK